MYSSIPFHPITSHPSVHHAHPSIHPIPFRHIPSIHSVTSHPSILQSRASFHPIHPSVYPIHSSITLILPLRPYFHHTRPSTTSHLSVCSSIHISVSFIVSLFLCYHSFSGKLVCGPNTQCITHCFTGFNYSVVNLTLSISGAA